MNTIPYVRQIILPRFGLIPRAAKLTQLDYFTLRFGINL
jgi:hypothetical protein